MEKIMLYCYYPVSVAHNPLITRGGEIPGNSRDNRGEFFLGEMSIFGQFSARSANLHFPKSDYNRFLSLNAADFL